MDLAHDLDDTARYRAVAGRDRRFDGVFYVGVHSTGIYCRPSCPARTPARVGVSFHPTAAAAQSAGFRACKRCLPDATPDSPRWDLAADTAGRAMRLVADGVVEREGVEGLAARLGYSPRQLHRILVAELGAGPLALARALRAQRARTLVQGTEWRFADVAHAAGFDSVRQFNDTMREVYASTPSQLRGATRRGAPAAGGTLAVRVPVRSPFAAGPLLRFLADRTVPGVEVAGAESYSRTLRLPHGPATLRVHLPDRDDLTTVECRLRLSDLRDLGPALERCRRLLDTDCDPAAVASVLGAGVLRPLVVAEPGLRVPGHVDGAELTMRAVLGQQVSVSHARRLAGLLVGLAGEPLPDAMAEEGLTALFPAAAAVAALDPSVLPMPRTRAEALLEVASLLDSGDLAVDHSQDRGRARQLLTSVRGIGSWTADYVAMRALGDPDVMLSTDAGVRRALALPPAEIERVSQAWRPWRSYALMHLWHSPSPALMKGN